MILPSISLCVTTYNSGKYVEQTLSSVFNQTIPFDEVIVVDDCSSDKTLDIIKKLALSSKIKMFTTKKNFGGPSVSRNIGIKNCRTDIISFLDADDLCLPNRCEIIKSTFCKQLGIIAITPSIKMSFLSTHNLNKQYKNKWFKTSNQNEIFNFFIGTPGSCINIFLKNTKISFDENKNIISGEDRELIIKAYQKKLKIIILHEPLFIYNDTIKPSVFTHLSNPFKTLKVYNYLFKKYKTLIFTSKNPSFFLLWFYYLIKNAINHVIKYY